MPKTKAKPLRPPSGREHANKANRRGSPEAIEKRRAARMFNDVLGGHVAGGRLDGRTEKRRQRLLQELESGMARGSRELKPLDVLTRVQELLELGESLATIRKVAKIRKLIVPPETVTDVVSRLHKAYNFRPEAYRFVGIGDDILRAAGVMGSSSSRAGGAGLGSVGGPSPSSRRSEGRGRRS